MRRRTFAMAIGTGVGLTLPVASTAIAQNWVTFTNETASRIVAPSGLGSTDPEEKDFAYADLDQDGDIDLIVVRKQPFTNGNGKRNILFMNENGVLVDRTNEFATAATDGGQGFLDITNDRDVAIADFNNDGWLDFVTCPALNQSMPKTISHPRIYMNLGKDGQNNWLGFRYEETRIPLITPAPNGCGIAAGDVTGDGFADIYVVDYLSSLEDRLLINDGTGVFTDQTLTRMTQTMINSGFGTAGAIVDMNNDGVNDIVKSENGPFKASYNNPANQGFFNLHETASSGAHYGMSVGELNNDGKLDVVLGDDGADRYLLNNGPGADGMANFTSKTFSFISGGDDGFANNSRIADLNNDGFNDVLIADVDVDIGGCSRRLHIYRNLGNLPNVTLQEQGTGAIPTSELTGTHDVAVFDLNGDGWNDIIAGRCAGLRVFINQPPAGFFVSYPQGLPAFVSPYEENTFQVKLNAIGKTSVVPGTELLHFAVENGGEQVVPLSSLGDGVYEATLPAVNCTDTINWWITTMVNPGNAMKSDPPGAPTNTYLALAAIGTDITYREEFEGSTDTWTVTNHPSLTSGSWQAADPNGTMVSGQQSAPDSDATSGDGVIAFVTQNGSVGGAPQISDVDNGPTMLTSPTIDALDGDALISFAAWFFCDDAGAAGFDTLTVRASNDDGQSWTTVMDITGTGGNWKSHVFRLSDYLVPTSTVRVQFLTEDLNNNSTTEAGIDNFQIEMILCPDAPCPGDLTGDGSVNGADLAVILSLWGQKGTPGFYGDLTGDGLINGADLTAVLGAWGDC